DAPVRRDRVLDAQLLDALTGEAMRDAHEHVRRDVLPERDRSALRALAAGLEPQGVDAERVGDGAGELSRDVVARDADRLLAEARGLVLAELARRLPEEQHGED